MRNTTPKDELPEDVFLQPGDGDRAKMRVVGGQFQVLGENGDWHDGSAGKLPPWNRESIAAAAARYPDPLGWRRALAYYDEQVGRQANNQCTTQSAACPKCGSSWTPAELPCPVCPATTVRADDGKPSYIPPNAPFCWVTDGQSERDLWKTQAEELLAERDTALARAKRAEVDAELLRASAKTFQAAEKEALARAEKAERERDDYSRRIEAAFERENASKARAEKAEGDCQAALKAWHREEETVREMRRERNEAQARVRKLEAKLQGTQEELDKFTGAFERELKRADQVTAELGKVAAQRDRAWDTNEILKEQMEAMASDARKLSDDFAGLLEDNAKEAVRTKVDTKPRPACIPDGVTEWTTLPESGLACWKDKDGRGYIEDRLAPPDVPWTLWSRSVPYGSRAPGFRRHVSPADFHAARRFMGWE